MTNYVRILASPRGYVLSAMIAAALAPKAHAETAHADAPATGGGSDSVTFDPDFFPTNPSSRIDISRFSKSGYVLPGTYRADVILNRQWRAREDVVFSSEPGSEDVHPCLDAKLLARYGVDLEKVAAAAAEGKAEPLPQGRFCAPLSRYIPDATTSFDGGSQELTLTVPQIYERRQARGYVDPSQWDSGITAATVSYNASAYNNAGDHNYSSAYLGINAAGHYGAWHLYHQGALSSASGQPSSYQATATYLRHDIPSLRGQVTAGDTFTSGELFDSVRVRGVQVATDDRMLPQSLRGFAPVVRGVAETNARVVIRQNGYVIYETNAAPGPFQIDDLYPTGYGGDLNVEVIEADGRVKRFTVPFSTVAQLLRPGISRWSVTAGVVSEQNMQSRPQIMQGTFQHGLTNDVTAYGGVTLASGYRAVVAGSALNTSVGAFSADVTHAHQSVSGQSSADGLSVRLGYNKNIADTGTNLAVAAYRYSTQNYVALSDMIAIRDAVARGLPTDTVLRQRSRVDLNVSQSLGEKRGVFNVTSSMRNYWSGSRSQWDFSVGYTNQWRSLTYSINVQRTRDSFSILSPGADTVAGAPRTGRWDTRVFLNVSVPLGSKATSPTVMTSYAQSREGASSQVNLSGNATEDGRLAYGVAVGRNYGNTSFNANTRYNSPYGQFGGNYSQGTGYRQVGASASGSMVMHGGGVTLAPTVGETIGLIHAPNATGAQVQNGQGAVVDSTGYAVVPNLQPYELNTVTLDPKGTAVGTELKETTAHVAPRLGSVVLLKYEAKSGRAVIVDSQKPDGSPLPFGADVLDDEGTNVGVVGQASRLIVNGLQKSGGLTVRWGEGVENSCRVDVTLPDTAPTGGYERIAAPCGPALRMTQHETGADADQPALKLEGGTPLHRQEISSLRLSTPLFSEMQG